MVKRGLFERSQRMTFLSADCVSAMPSATSAVVSGSLPATTTAWKRRSDCPSVRPSASQRLIRRWNVAVPFGDPRARLAGRARNPLRVGAGGVRTQDDAIHGDAVANDRL